MFILLQKKVKAQAFGIIDLSIPDHKSVILLWNWS